MTKIISLATSQGQAMGGGVRALAETRAIHLRMGTLPARLVPYGVSLPVEALHLVRRGAATQRGPLDRQRALKGVLAQPIPARPASWPSPQSLAALR